MKTCLTVRVRLLSALVLLGAAVASRAILPTDHELPNFDRRGPVENVAGAVARAAAVGNLTAQLPDAIVDFDELARAKWVRSRTGFLTGPGGVGRAVATPMALGALAAPGRLGATQALLREHAGLFGFGPEALEAARVTREFTTAHSGLATVVWQQQLDGIPVFEAIFISHTTQQGELVSVTSQFVPNPTTAAAVEQRNWSVALNPPPVAPEQAVALAAVNLGEELEAAAVTALGAAAEGAERKQYFEAAPLAGPAEARLVWLPLSPETLRLCWEVVLTSRARGEMFRVLVDAETGVAQVRHRLTEYLSDASYRVFLSDSPSPFSPGCPTLCTTQPAVNSQVLVTLSALDTNASPSGWIDDGVNETRGNNVAAHTDRNADNAPDLPRPQGSPFRTFDFTANLNLDPATYTNAAVTDLFYWCNWMHDQLYLLGFTEAAGNFQNNNFGRGGFGNDALQADAQDGSGFNNANMSTPGDGSAPRMQMFLFNGPTPDRDGDFDHEIVLHEYTHGLSNRRVGGGVGLTALQSRGMGEGWSDWYGLALLSEDGDDPNGCYAAGAYATYLLSGLTTNYYFGIRRYPYSTDLTKNPLTFRDIDPTQASPHTGVPRSPIIGNTASEVHNQGEVWCAALWDLRANLIAKLGFTNGNQLSLQLVTDGMNLTPPNPTFLQARDGILQAELVLCGGTNRGELWSAFAKRGMGASASAPASSTTTGVIEAFDVLDDLVVTPGTGFSASGPVGGPFAPSARTFVLLNTGGSNLTWTAGTGAPWLSVSSNGGVLAPGSTNSVTVSLSASAYNLPAGVYNGTVVLSNATSGLAQSRSFALRVGQPDYFTELFSAGDNDLDFQTFTFTPDGSASYYSVCREPATVFPTDPTTGIVLSVPSDSYTMLSLATNISLYGRATNVIYVGSGGYITLQSGDGTTTPSLANHFRLPRIAALSLHVHPSEGGPITWQQLSNRVVVSFRNMREWATTLTNHYQIEMFFDGRIRMTFLSMASTGGLAGLSAGGGLPADFLESDLSGYGPCVQPLTLQVPSVATEGDGVLVGQGAVRIYATNAGPLTVTLSSADPSEITLPVSVVIPAGQSNATFDITIVDDGDLDGAQLVNLNAASGGYGTATTTLQVNDNETAVLGLGGPGSVAEGSGTALVSVFSSAAPTATITVGLSSSDTTEIQVPATVVLPAGQTSAVFSVTIVNDSAIDGPQPTTITASVTNWTPGFATLTVLDNETTNLTVALLPSSAREGDGTLPNAGVIRISGTLTTNLPVTLQSSDPTELIVPPSATILAGQTNATFDLTIVDDPEIDSTQTVTVFASADGFAQGGLFDIMFVTDDESPPEPFNPTPAHLASNVIQTSDLSWANGAVPGETITNDVYFGTNPTPGPAELLGTTTSSSWTLPTLWPQTTYYWQIVARKTGVTPGPVWQFTTRGVDHFVWDAIPSPQYAGEPFTVTLTAKDAFATTVSNFSAAVSLTGVGAGGPVTNVILGNLSHVYSGSGSYSLGYSFTPNTNLTVTHVRSYAGTKVSIWTDTGTLLTSRAVSGLNGVWTETPLAAPLNLLAGVRYRVAIYTGTSGLYYWREDGGNTFSHGVINFSYQSSGDTFPTLGDTVRWWFVDLRYTTGGSESIPITPTNLTTFANGSWTGPLTAHAPTTNLVLRADDGAGHFGVSAPLVIGLRNDLAVSVTDLPDPVSLGGTLTYAITVTNLGPASATGVVVTNELPSTASPVAVTLSQGTVTTNGNVLVCDLGTLPGDTLATVSIVARANNVGTLTNRVVITRAEPDAYLPNNSAVNLTAVQTPTISVNDVSFYEGNTGATSANFNVSISPAPALPASVAFATGSGTATAPEDFVSTNGIVIFAPGETNQVVSVRVITDVAYEYDESFALNLSAPVNATLADDVGVGNLLNDDPIPMLSIGDATLVEGNVGRTNAVFPVNLSAPSGLPVSFYFYTSEGSAYAGADYISTNSYLALPVGSTTTNIVVPVVGDLQTEMDEVFYVDLNSASGAMLLKREGIGLILNDDGLPGNLDHFVWATIPSPQYAGRPFGVTITARDAFNNPAVNFTGPAQLRVSASGLTNLLGTDLSEAAFPMYTGSRAERTQVIYPASELGGPGPIAALALDVASLPYLTLSNWTIRIKHTPLTSYSSYTWESTNWTVVCQSNLTVTATGLLVLPFAAPFQYDGTSSLMIDFSFYNATTYGSGYCRSTSRSTTRTLYYYTSSYGDPLTWSGSSPYPYTTSYTPNLQLMRLGELTAIEPALTGLFTNGVWSGAITATLPATNAVLLAADGLGHAGESGGFAVELVDDLALTLTATPDPVAVGGSLTYELVVTNTGPAAATGVVVTNELPAGVTLVSVTATQGSYTNFGPTVVGNLGTINGTNQATLRIVVSAGNSGLITNAAWVSRFESEHYTANNSRQAVTAVQVPALSISSASTDEGHAGTTPAVFNVALVPPAVTEVVVSFATSNGTALAGSDYVAVSGLLNFSPGQSNQPITVQVLGDTNNEPDETFSVVLSSPVNAALGAATGTGTIINDDVGPFFDDFEPSIDLTQWSSFGGVVGSTILATNYGGSVSGVKSLWFGADTSRYAASRTLNTLSGGSIRFYLRLASGGLSGQWETVDLPSEGVVLEYSNNGGNTWTEMGRYDNSVYYNWTLLNAPIPVGAQTAATQFRWRQLSHSGSCCDHWALDDVQALVGPQAPVITTPPSQVIAPVGGTASFVVGAQGSAPLSYRWFKGGTNLVDDGRISGSSSNQLTIGAVQTSDAGFYQVMVSNAVGTAWSSNVTLTVTTNLALTIGIAASGDATEREALAGTLTNLGFNVQLVAQGQWTGLDVVLSYPGASSFGPSIYEISNGWSYVQISDHGSDWTPNSFVTLADGALVTVALDTAHPITSGLPDSWTTFGFWRYGYSSDFLGWGTDTSLPSLVRATGTNSQTRLLVAQQKGSGRAVYVGWNVYGPAADANDLVLLRNAILWAANRSLGVPPAITNQPLGQTVAIGQTAQFTLGASGSSPLAYQWRKAGVSLAQQTNATLTISNVQSADAGSYSVVVTNAYGSATSSNAVLTVLPPPQLRFLEPERVAGRLRLRITTSDSSPIPPARASNIWVYATTNLAVPLSNWTAIATAPVLGTNGVLVVDGINLTNPPQLFFRAIEGSWNVRPLRLHLPQLNGGTWTLRAGPADGSPLTPMRAARVRFYSSTNVVRPFQLWLPLVGTPVLSNGVVNLDTPAAPQSQAVYFRAEETP